jgi:hypothetical protein
LKGSPGGTAPGMPCHGAGACPGSPALSFAIGMLAAASLSILRPAGIEPPVAVAGSSADTGTASGRGGSAAIISSAADAGGGGTLQQ